MKKYTIDQLGLKKITLKEPGEYLIELTVPGAEAKVSGVFTTAGAEVSETKVTIHHKAPNTLANTTLKGAARDQSKISFTGRIIIDQDCGNTNSFLTERILLLSDEAKAEAIPDLEILTDDVKCSHAASISRIPESQLFYLMSRGISRSQAEELIVAGFLENKDE
ncbi:MAG: Fe-S cluster assembly protein SufD [Patescibacteria group bacterium]|jgi:Fe-S cluster assembly protein SufD|nr:Fe-S cluster assembly protein SufD [Patescibacteria group bacterium]